jgi:hypothetical protein
MWLHKSDPIFNMGVGIMRPTFNLEPKYRVTMLNGEKWIGGPGTSTIVKRARLVLVYIWVQDDGGDWS